MLGRPFKFCLNLQMLFLTSRKILGFIITFFCFQSFLLGSKRLSLPSAPYVAKSDHILILHHKKRSLISFLLRIPLPLQSQALSKLLLPVFQQNCLTRFPQSVDPVLLFPPQGLTCRTGQVDDERHL